MGYEKYKIKSQEILEGFDIHDIQDEHLLDTVLCSFCTYEALKGNTILLVNEAEDEGWCYPLLIKE